MKGNEWVERKKPEILAEVNEFFVQSKTITVLAGNTNAGKTSVCLHLAKDAVAKGHKTMYVATESKDIIDRPAPNLFVELSGKNVEGFKKFFVYDDETNMTSFFAEFEKINPKLLIIDSIYEFAKGDDKEQNPYKRAAIINSFLGKLRILIREKEVGCVVTTKMGRVVDPKTGDGEIKILGGDGLKYVADSKIVIDFRGQGKNDGDIGDGRFFVIDKQIRYPFTIEYGGVIKPVKKVLPFKQG